MSEKLKRIDYFGALSMVSAVSLLLVGISTGGTYIDRPVRTLEEHCTKCLFMTGNQLPWGHPLVYGSLIGGGVLLVVFVLVEKYVAREPLLPLRVLISPTPLFVALTCWFITMSQFGILYNVPLYFSTVEQTTTSYAGLHLIPNAVFASTASLLSGLYMARTGTYKNLLIGSGICGMLGPILMYTWDYKRTPEWLYWLSMIPAGIGYGKDFSM
jgi:hypothetical protein